MVLDLPQLLRDGAILSALASAWVIGALRFNPRLFLRHYPKEIREAVPPLTAAERKASKLIGLPFLFLLIGFPIYSATILANTHPEADFVARAVHGFGVSMTFNAVDLVLLDLLWMGAIRPRWAMMPGTQSVAYRFNTIDHVRGFAVGTLMAIIIGLIAAAASGF